MSCGRSSDTASGQAIQPADTACKTQQVQIAVHDGFLQNLCGCTESSAQIILPPTQLTCTAAAGTQIEFLVFTAHLEHQIISTGTTLTFPSSPRFDPMADMKQRVHAFVLNTPGTYSFTDAYDNSMIGQITIK